MEARGVVRQALDILTPAMPARMEDGNVWHLLCLYYQHSVYSDLMVNLIIVLITYLHVLLLNEGFDSFSDDANSLDEENHRGRGPHSGTVGSHAVCHITST